MASPILITGAVGRTVTELLLKQGKAVREMVRNEDQRAQALRRLGECHFRSESINSHFPHISRDVTNVVRHANATNVNAT